MKILSKNNALICKVRGQLEHSIWMNLILEESLEEDPTQLISLKKKMFSNRKSGKQVNKLGTQAILTNNEQTNPMCCQAETKYISKKIRF